MHSTGAYLFPKKDVRYEELESEIYCPLHGFFLETGRREMKRIDGSKKNRIKGALLTGVSLFLVNPFSIWAQQVTEGSSVNQLIIKLQERDQVIADLQRRVQQLEQRVGGVPQAPEPTKAAQLPAAPSDKVVAGQPARQAPVNEAAKEAPPVAAAQGKTGAGSFVVDEEAAERALERTLVQTGALLLPFGLAEIQPYVNYARFDNEQPVLLRDAAGNIGAVTDIHTRRNDIETGVFSRLGLPFGAQVELGIPARIVNASSVVGIVNQETENTTSALGDIRVGLAKTLLRESGWLPDIVGRITWDTDTGKQQTFNNALTGGLAGTATGVGMATSFNELNFSATALKRQDPLAFTSSLSYRKTFAKNGVEPGDVYSLALGATLAASPQTSLSVGIQQSFIGNTRIFNNSIPGTDTINSVFTFGASSIIGSRLFFTTVAGIGLTKHAPDYFISVAIPLRFEVPFKKRGS
jgi:hypothetical protein